MSEQLEKTDVEILREAVERKKKEIESAKNVVQVNTIVIKAFERLINMSEKQYVQPNH